MARFYGWIGAQLLVDRAGRHFDDAGDWAVAGVELTHWLRLTFLGDRAAIVSAASGIDGFAGIQALAQ